MDKQAVFNNLTAWFSRSVSSRRKTLWTKHGGRILDVPDAQFIFSQDVEDWDTKSLFKTEDYLIGCLTVFHAGFIDACLKNQSAHRTPVSKFVLLPKDAPKVLHSILISVDKSLEANPRGSPPSSATAQAAGSRNRPTAAVPRQDANREEPLPDGGNGADHHRTESGDIMVDAPTGNRIADGQVVHQGTVVNKVQRRNEGEVGERRSDGTDVLASREFSDSNKMGLTDAPHSWNLDVSKIPHVRDLPKASGPILDFVIGKNGCGVEKIENT